MQKGKLQMIRICVATVLVCMAIPANADEVEELFTDWRCDNALPFIIDGRKEVGVFFSETEAAKVDGFLLGFGLLAAFDMPDSPNAAIGSALGGLMAVCQNEPSRTIFELAERHFRK